MPSGNSRPYISYQCVRAALESLLYVTAPPQPNMLESLLLVELLLTHPDTPHTDEPRAFAVKHILVDIITREYSKHRQNMGLHLPTDGETLEQVSLSIQEDRKTQNQELLSWSVLYYRYVCVNLNLPLEAISDRMGVEERTLRRYQKHAIRRLTEFLIDAEWRARQRERRLRLNAALPTVVPMFLVGRETQLASLQKMIEVSSPTHLYITGAAGVGKTTFVQEFVRRWIDADLIDHLVWVDNPPSAEYVIQYLCDALGLSETNIGLKEYSLHYRLAVILDGVEWTGADYSDTLIGNLSGAVVFLISRVYKPFLHYFKHFSLAELDERATIQLVHAVAGQNIDTDLLEDYGRQVWRMIGGNPLAIKMSVQGLQIYDSVMVGTLNPLFDHAYTTLDDFARATWIALSLFPSGAAKLQHLFEIWPLMVNQESVYILLRHHLAEFNAQTQTCSLTTTARQYIQQKCDTVLEIQPLLNDLLKPLDQNPIAFDVIEHILFEGWPRLSIEHRANWVKQLMHEGLKRERYVRWLMILKQAAIPDYKLQVAQAVCLRHLADWQQAEHILLGILEETGEKGLFSEQGRPALELGILLRLRSQYEQAERYFSRAHKTAVRFGDHNLLHDVQLEYAQLAVDRRDGRVVEALLNNLPVTVRTLALQAESRLLLHDTNGTMRAVQQAMAMVGDNVRMRSRLNDLLGRLYEQQGDLTSAEYFFSIAVTALEQHDDAAGLARAQANLGAVLIGLKRHEDAYNLLTRAENVLLWLGDRAALLAVRHNLNILRRRIAG